MLRPRISCILHTRKMIQANCGQFIIINGMHTQNSMTSFKLHVMTKILLLLSHGTLKLFSLPFQSFFLIIFRLCNSYLFIFKFANSSTCHLYFVITLNYSEDFFLLLLLFGLPFLALTFLFRSFVFLCWEFSSLNYRLNVVESTFRPPVFLELYASPAAHHLEANCKRGRMQWQQSSFIFQLLGNGRWAASSLKNKTKQTKQKKKTHLKALSWGQGLKKGNVVWEVCRGYAECRVCVSFCDGYLELLST